MATTDDIEDLRTRLDRVNRGRLGLTADADALAREEADIEADFGPAIRLAIYGTLAPGKVNHHHIANLGGAWSDAAVRGSLAPIEHGEHKGLPGIYLDPSAPPHPVKLLVSSALPSAWTRLDAFEGAEMQRLLVPLEGGGGILGVANVYALRRAMTAALG
ncbi:MAG: gamma-glutamylcyclotransferase family protein [Kiloniellaceae bacterium]